MSSQGFRQRDTEGSRPTTPTEASPAAERSRESPRTGPAPSAATSPNIPARQLPFPESTDLGSAATLLQIAHSQTHPDPQSALEALKIRIKGTLQSDTGVFSIPTRTTLRDMATTSDSLWIPTLKALLAILVCALLAAVIYGILQLLQPAAPETVPVAGHALALLLSF